MTRPADQEKVGWLPLQNEALLAWVGAVADMPAGYAPCDGNIYNGYQTKNLNNVALRTAPSTDTEYGLINNNSYIGNDVVTENTMVFGSNEPHTHNAETSVSINGSDGAHVHGEGNISAEGFKEIGYVLHANAEYGGTNASNVNIVVPGEVHSNTKSSPGKPLEGTFEDSPDGHNHRVVFDSVNDGMTENENNSSVHAHAIEGGDGSTCPAIFTVTWLVWVGYF